GVIRDATRHHRTCRDNTITADGQLSLRTNDRCASSDPGSLANPDSAAFRDTLIDDRCRDIFIGMIMVYNQHPLGDENITFYVYLIFGGDDSVSSNGAIVLNYNRG